MKKQVLPLRVSDRIFEFVDKESKRLQISRSEVMRRILDEYIDNHQNHKGD